MMWIPGGTFHMGSDAHYPEEAPVRPVTLDGFWIDRFPVTNREFARFFVAETGHVTQAEIAPSASEFPDADPRLLVAGSLVFGPTTGVGGGDWASWWRFLPGANWRHPQGPHDSLAGLEDHPVVHVAHGDAVAYARWLGKDLPSEAEWEYAARGGLDRAEFAWGDELAPGGVHRANTWQGRFPDENLALDGYAGTPPVTAFPPNGYGLHDMIGNVWEWTDDWYDSPRDTAAVEGCCRHRDDPDSGDRPTGVGSTPVARRKVLKGGSHLCAPNYCRRYRPAARQPQTIDTGSVHIGFRCVRRTVTI